MPMTQDWLVGKKYLIPSIETLHNKHNDDRQAPKGHKQDYDLQRSHDDPSGIQPWGQSVHRYRVKKGLFRIIYLLDIHLTVGI